MYTSIAASTKRRETSESFPQESFRMVNTPENVSDHHKVNVQPKANAQPKSIEKSYPITNPETAKLYKMFQQEFTIIAEYKMLQTESLHGVYIIPSFESSFLWFGVIFVRSGHYEGGVFRFTLTLPETFPECDCPTVTFQSQVFHPAVDSITGVLSLNEVFPKWTKNTNHVWQILKYVHWIFQNINVKSPANVEAMRLFKMNKTHFIEKAKECVMLSIDHLYDEPPTDDKHYISFSPYDPQLHDSVRESMLTPSSPTVSTSQGLSWVKPGSFQPFTKPNTDSDSR